MKNLRKGKCCRNFVLPYSIHQLKRAYQAWYSHEKEYKWRGEVKSLPKDIHIVYPMAIPLFDGKKQKYEPANNNFIKKGTYHYTCKHFDKKTSNCTIYECRPNVCLGYPYGEVCKYKKCYCKYKGTK